MHLYDTKKAVNKIIAEWLSVALVLFELYMAVPWGVLIPASIAMQVHLLLVFTIGYLTLPLWKDAKGPLNIVMNALFFVLTTASIIHIASLFQDLSIRSSIPHTIDVIMGTILVIAVLDLVRRKIGWAFVIVCVVFILYSLFGQYVPIRSLSHGGLYLEADNRASDPWSAWHFRATPLCHRFVCLPFCAVRRAPVRNQVLEGVFGFILPYRPEESERWTGLCGQHRMHTAWIGKWQR